MERQGFAYDEEEQTEGVCAIGAPFRDATGTTCSLSVIVPSPRFKVNLARFRAALTRCRDDIEMASGIPDADRRGSAPDSSGSVDRLTIQCIVL